MRESSAAFNDVKVCARSKSAPESSKDGNQDKIKEMHQKKTQLEHILLHPDAYIGSVERIKDTTWECHKVVAEEGDEVTYKMNQREISYVPGLYMIFDEILVNAAGEDIQRLNFSC